MVLDDIKKAFPNLEVFWPYMELLNKESDRGAVLISTGFLEQQLRDILAAFMCEGTSAPLLDGANAPLGRFSSRISACHALGLITANEHNDLNILRRVRTTSRMTSTRVLKPRVLSTAAPISSTERWITTARSLARFGSEQVASSERPRLV
jgi:hypothetical protein